MTHHFFNVFSKVVYPVIYSILLEARRMESLSNLAFPHSCILIFFFFFTVGWRKLRHFLLRAAHSGLKDTGYWFSQLSQRSVLSTNYPCFTGRTQATFADMGPKLCQVLKRSASVPSRGFWEGRRTFSRNLSSKAPIHPAVWASPPCPANTVTATTVLLPSVGEQPGWPLMSPWGVPVPPIMGWGKRGTDLTSLLHFIHNYSEPRCWILILAHIILHIVRKITCIVSTWDHNNNMGTDADIIFFGSVKLPLCFSFLDFFSR